MLILDSNNSTIIIDSVHTPVTTKHFWVLDFNMSDYTLAPLLMLEEIVAPTIEIVINGFHFVLPANWNMLIVDPDTAQLDVIEIGKLAGHEFKAFVYGVNTPNFEAMTVSVANYHPHFYNFGPSLYKNQMLCHPISPDKWINVAPADTYNKYLKGMVAGDLI